MEAELALVLLLRCQLAVTVGVVLVLCLRLPARAIIGPGLAHRLWAIVPLSGISALFPPMADFVSGPRLRASFDQPLGVGTVLAANRVWGTHAAFALALWGAGALLTLTAFVRAEARFRRKARLGKAGPAVVGLGYPRLVVPADYFERFDARERQMIRTHERAHVEAGHLSWNAAAAVLQVFGWFNPLVHLAAAAARSDQELACDARVLEGRPALRRPYAELLLKASGPRGGPLSCALSGQGRVIELRLRSLLRPEISLARYGQGVCAVGAAALLAIGAIWTLGPSEGFGPPASAPPSYRPGRTPKPGSPVLQLELIARPRATARTFSGPSPSPAAR